MKNKNRKTKSKNVNTKNNNIFFYKHIITVLFLVNTVCLFLTFFGNTGFIGQILKNAFKFLFGSSYYIFLIINEIILTLVLIKKVNKENYSRVVLIYLLYINYISIIDLYINSSNSLSIKLSIAKSLSVNGKGTGILGALFGFFYYKMIGTIGLYLFTFILCVLLILLSLNITFFELIKIIKDKTSKLYVKIFSSEKNNNNDINTLIDENHKDDINSLDENLIISNYEDATASNVAEKELLDSFDLFPDINIVEGKEILPKSNGNKAFKYNIPSLNLLNISKSKKTEADTLLRERALKIENTLKSFGVGAKVTKINKGPTVTCFELQPDMGVKVNKIVNLSDDLSLALASSDIRIEAPIPGKSVVGIEVANTVKEEVSLREILSSSEYINCDSIMPMALGKTISGEIIVSSIDKMPHLLIAGATGSGKSVCINTIIMSILFKSSPEDVKMILIDPKVVELNVYNNIPHLAIPVVTDSKKASAALNWAVREMERRYGVFSDNQVRDIKGYIEKQKENDLEKLPYIVIIIDELSDLMMVSASEVESHICRLAQMARACGIHLIVATQRPSVDVITGTIKANIPSRISFQVSSQIDSRTILDSSGAEALLGKGDMLFNPSSSSKPTRIQGCYVSDLEVERVVNSIKSQIEEVIYDEEIIRNIEEEYSETEKFDDVDDLFYDAVKIILEENTASISLLQRKMKIGYARAGRIIDEMEKKSIISKQDGSKPRKILIGFDYLNSIEEVKKNEHCK